MRLDARAGEGDKVVTQSELPTSIPALLRPYAYGVFDGTVNPPTIQLSSGVTSVVRTGTGQYTVTLDAPVSDQVFMHVRVANAGGSSALVPKIRIDGTNVFSLWCYNYNGSYFNLSISFMVFDMNAIPNGRIPNM